MATTVMVSPKTQPTEPIADAKHETSAESHIEHESIARLAYDYWRERQDTGVGSPEEDWLRAERELRGN